MEKAQRISKKSVKRKACSVFAAPFSGTNLSEQPLRRSIITAGSNQEGRAERSVKLYCIRIRNVFVVGLSTILKIIINAVDESDHI